MRAIEEAAGARLLHHLGTGIAAHAAESVIAEDDGTVLHPSIGNDKFSICRGIQGQSNVRKTTPDSQTQHAFATRELGFQQLQL